ncbi:SpoIIE family protein phosphatase [Mycobacterium sp.]|uniref:SpoIIE family protein phosphatase n=1 Tax=Mycobacterium sp. TaxID=1785 RepID=UPI001275DB54|nr:SpoIIE family protein phosphatase [Mycobacterium sp.]KAA8963883.1 MAG: SpoIIE family protein phosphatase [Mycobacterium sp.]
MVEHGRFGLIEWAAAGRALAGERVCGDRAIAVGVDGAGVLVGVLDGLGHGAEAATAAGCGVEVLRGARTESLDVLVRLCHRALTATRGAAMTLARIDDTRGTLRWIGIGNVTANLVAKRPGGIAVRSSVRSAAGIVGYRLPEVLTPQEVSIRPGDVLIIASDGIGENHMTSIDFAAPALVNARQILADHAKSTDDALVLVARHRGTSR